MPVKLTDKVLNEAGQPIEGATAQAIYTNGTAATLSATDTTDAKGVWAFDSTIAGHQGDLADPALGYWYDVKINAGLQYRLRYGAIKAMMSMIYLSQDIVLASLHILDASLARLRIPVRYNATPAGAQEGDVVWRGSDAELTNTPAYRGRMMVNDGLGFLPLEFQGHGHPGENAITLQPGDTAYTIQPKDGYIFCQGTTTLTLPDAWQPSNSTMPAHRVLTIVQLGAGPSTLVPINGATIRGGSFYSGIVNNGKIQAGDALTYKAMAVPGGTVTYVWVLIAQAKHS